MATLAPFLSVGGVRFHLPVSNPRHWGDQWSQPRCETVGGKGIHVYKVIIEISIF